MCLDKNKTGYEKVPVEDCAENPGIYNLTEWEGSLDAEFIGLTGKTCTCDGSGCNYMQRKSSGPPVTLNPLTL